VEFYKEFIEKDINPAWKIKERIAVRAVIFHKGNLLLVHNNKGDYKFPGGGVEKGEVHNDALIREIREETGYVNGQVKYRIGTVIERWVDQFEEETLFQMTSNYYLCELANEEKVSQQLDDYEYEQEFSPVWVPLNEAIKTNESLVGKPGGNGWVRRETFVLKELRNGA
jgi:8-oxo-dGTP pyrophosphatase MutT (NUDIX family)